MNAWFATDEPVWRLAGWTMLHFLWLGTAATVGGGSVRLALRHKSPGLRYTVSLATLATLAVLPMGIAVWLSVHPNVMGGARMPPALPVDESPSIAIEAGLFAEGVPRQSRGLSPEVLAPVQREGLAGASAEGGDLPALGRESGATPGRSPGVNRAGWLERVATHLPWIWIVGAPVTFALLAAGLVGSQRLRVSGTAIVAGPAMDVCRQMQVALGVTRRVAVAACDRIVQPVLVGIVRPTILLPAAALAGWSPAELEMVLAHELAHVRRWDNLVNLVQRLVESLLFFHPCVWLASRQVRRDREECCDALVVRHTARPEAYATLLVSIAAAVRARRAPHLAAASAMADHPLAGRIRRILKLEDETMRVSRKTLVVMALVVVAALAAPALRGRQPVHATTHDERGDDDQALVTIEYSAAEIQRINSRDWIRLMAFVEAESATFRWNYREEIAQITAPQAFHKLIKRFLDGQGGQWPLFAKTVSAPPHVHRRIEALLAQEGAAGEGDSSAAEAGRLSDVFEESDALPETTDAELPEPAEGTDRGEQADASTSAAKVEKGGGPFLSEANQAIADVAYRTLGLEVEPLTATSDEARLIESLGFNNGVRIIGVRNPSTYDWKEGDVLVGVHTWPVEDMAALAAVLDRVELASLSPVKCVVVSPAMRQPKVIVRLDVRSQAKQAFASPHRLAPGDVISVRVARLEDRVLQEYTIEDEGTVALGPEIGRVPVAGLTVPEAEAAIAAHLKDRELITDAKVQVMVIRKADGGGEPARSFDNGNRSNPSFEGMGTLVAPRLAAGDVVFLRAVGAFPEAPLDDQYTIEDAGTIPLGPAYGRVDIAGMSLLDAERAIENHLETILTDVSLQLTFVRNPAVRRVDVRLPEWVSVEEARRIARELRDAGHDAIAVLTEDGFGLDLGKLAETSDLVLEVESDALGIQRKVRWRVVPKAQESLPAP